MHCVLGELSKDVPVHLHNSKQNITRIKQLISVRHKKSTNISIDMIKQTDDFWMISSSTDVSIQFKVEKAISSCNGCILNCKLCQICIHTYTCTCNDNALYLNICEHIHACAQVNKSITQQNSYMSSIIPVLSENQIVVNDQLSDYLESEKDIYDVHSVFHSQIKSKMEMMVEIMSNKTNSSKDDLNNILKYCDKILSVLKKNLNFKETAVSHSINTI